MSWVRGFIRTAVVVTALACAAANGMAKDKEHDGKKAFYRELLDMKADSFEKQNSKEDILRAFTTHSQLEGTQNVAYVVVKWGDLENMIRKPAKGYYRNWDGYLSVDNGTAEVVGRLAFDDGANRATAHPNIEKVNPKHKKESAKKTSKTTGPREGSGRDALLPQTDLGRVEWDAGVVGATDGLAIKLTLKAATAAGTIKAGRFTVPFSITPMPKATN